MMNVQAPPRSEGPKEGSQRAALFPPWKGRHPHALPEVLAPVLDTSAGEDPVRLRQLGRPSLARTLK
jgi:hypothetical protein